MSTKKNPQPLVLLCEPRPQWLCVSQYIMTPLSIGYVNRKDTTTHEKVEQYAQAYTVFFFILSEDLRRA